MQEKKVPWSFKAIIALAKLFYPRYEIIATENIPDEPCLFIGNHAQLHGPLLCELHFPVPRYTWCIAQMLDRKQVPAYAFEDFWSKKPARTHWFYKLLARLMARPAAFLCKNANSIAVHHDHRVLSTFRDTIKVMLKGYSVVIFPECYDEYNPIVYQFQQGFVDAARIYYTKTHKEASFVPMYIAPAIKKLVIGAPIRYCAQNNAAEERERICTALMDSITKLAQQLPCHTVVPYPNMPKRDYPTNV